MSQQVFWYCHLCGTFCHHNRVYMNHKHTHRLQFVVIITFYMQNQFSL